MDQSSKPDAMSQGAEPEVRRNVAVDGEHPDVIVGDVQSRARPEARTIVVANEKGGTGKSTIAFHLTMALCAEGRSVAAIDLDVRQQTLALALLRRQGLAARQKVPLPMPKFHVVRVLSGAMLCQDLCRVGSGADVVIIDVAGCDSPIARRAIAIADVLVTPVGASPVDLELLGRPASLPGESLRIGRFAQAVSEIREARARRGGPAADWPVADWVVLPNRTRTGARRRDDPFTLALEDLSHAAGFRIGRGLTDRAIYKDLLPQGLSPLDAAIVPEAVRPDDAAEREIRALAEQLANRSCAAARGLEMRAAAPAGSRARAVSVVE